MACCLTAPSHYLNQCWLIIIEIQWHSYQGNFTRDASNQYHQSLKLKITYLIFHSNFPGANELKKEWIKLTYPPVPAEQPSRLWMDYSYESIYIWWADHHQTGDYGWINHMNPFITDELTATKLCAYFSLHCMRISANQQIQTHYHPAYNFPRVSKPVLKPGTHFTNNFSIIIKIWWIFHSALIQILIKWSLWNFAHGMTAVLSWHVQNFVAIQYPTLKVH